MDRAAGVVVCVCRVVNGSMDNTSVGSDGPAETDSGIESSSTSGASCDTLAYIRVAIPALDVQVPHVQLLLGPFHGP